MLCRKIGMKRKVNIRLSLILVFWLGLGLGGVSVSFVRSFCLLNNFLLVGTRSVVHYDVNHSYVLQACKGFQRIQLCLQSKENNQQ